jgi:acetylglutamate kinase
MKDSGLTATFIDGLRVSDAPSMDIIVQTLANEINPGIVQKLGELGGRAKGFPGYEVLRATKTRYIQEKTGREFDLGFVGDIAGVDTAALQETIRQEIVPVISPLGRDDAGQFYNINADIAAAEVAEALQAYKIIYLSDVNGIMRDPKQADTTIPSLTSADITQLKKDGVIDGGMLPKVDSAVKALKSGVQKVHFLDGRIPHSLLLEIFTDAGIGTEITLY